MIFDIKQLYLIEILKWILLILRLTASYININYKEIILISLVKVITLTQWKMWAAIIYKVLCKYLGGNLINWSLKMMTLEHHIHGFHFFHLPFALTEWGGFLFQLEPLPSKVSRWLLGQSPSCLVNACNVTKKINCWVQVIVEARHIMIEVMY